jgi:hypothetical protein
MIRSPRGSAVPMRLMALVSGEDAMACLCDSTPCPAADNRCTSPVVVHVLAEAATVEGHGERTGFVPGYGPLPPAMVRDVAKTARLKPVHVPEEGSATEPAVPAVGCARPVYAQSGSEVSLDRL